MTMQCERFQDEMAALLEGGAADADRVDLEAHRRACAPCAAAVDELRAVLADLRALPVAAPSGDFEDRVLARLAGRNASSRTRRARWAAAALLPLLAAGVLAAVLLHPAGPGLDAATAEARASVRRLAEVGRDFLLQVRHLDDAPARSAELVRAEFAISRLAPRVEESQGLLGRADPSRLEAERRFCGRMGEFVDRVARSADPAAGAREAAAELGLPAACETILVAGSGAPALPAQAAFTVDVQALPAVPGDAGQALHDFLVAKRAMYGGDRRGAQALFERFVSRHPQDPLADDAFYFTVRAAAAGDERLPLPGPGAAALLERAEPWFADGDAGPMRRALLAGVAEWRAELPEVIPLDADSAASGTASARVEIRLQRGDESAVLVDDPELVRALDALRRDHPAVEVRRRGELVARVVLPAELKAHADALAALAPFLAAYPELFVFRGK